MSKNVNYLSMKPKTPFLQEEPGTHVSPSRITKKELDVSHSSIRRMVKQKGYKNFKQMKTPFMT